MGLFSRKKQREEEETRRINQELMEELSKPPCERKGGHHLYRDFPPVLLYDWNGVASSEIIIQETYVCAMCHKRVERTLERWQYKNYKKDEFFDEVKRYKEKYKDFLQPRAIVEDMINDAIMVDKQRLMYWDQIHAAEPPKKEPFELKIKERNEYVDIR